MYYKTVEIDPNQIQIQPEVLKLVPESIARKYNAMPLEVVDNVLRVAMSQVDNILALQEMAAVAKLRIEPVAAGSDEIRVAIDNNYKAYREIEKQFNSVAEDSPQNVDRVNIDDVSDAPVVRALDLIVSEAIKVHASDIAAIPSIGCRGSFSASEYLSGRELRQHPIVDSNQPG